MSDDWNQQPHTEEQPHTQYQPYQEPSHDHHQGDQHQGDQTSYQPQPEFQPEYQHFEPTHEPVVEPVTIVHSTDEARLEAIEAAIADLRSHVAALQVPATEPAPIAEPAVEPVEAEVVEHAEAPTEDPVPEVTEEAKDPHAERLAAIEAEIAHVRAAVEAVTEKLGSIATDLSAHGALHAETKEIVEEQHQLLSGLNYIITTAIGTLTAGTKSAK